MNYKPKLYFLIFLLLLASFIILTGLIAQHPIPNIDIQISELLQKHHSEFADKLMLTISLFGELPWSLLLVVLVSAIFFTLKLRRESYYILCILLTGLVILGVKNIVNRPRPSADYVRLVEINRFQSFPSGHVMSYIVFFGFMIILMKTIKNVNQKLRNFINFFSIVLIITIPFSRIYLGAHWFTDILGGFLLGLMYLMPLSYFYLKRNVDKSLAHPRYLN